MNSAQGYACVPVKESQLRVWPRKIKQAVGCWLFLNIWCSHCYRPVMRLMHRFGLHYAPALPTPEPSEPLLGDLMRKQCWCQWCGLRGEVLQSKK